MKKAHALIAGSVLAATSMVSTTAAAETSVSANVGFVSDYFFRGVFQTASSGSAGLDVSFGPGFYAGTWLADVDDGIEYDLYAGWGGEYKGFTYDIGYYTYNYTDNWDETYAEVLLTLGYDWLSVSYADGTYDSTPEQDYSFTSVTAEYKGAYITYGTWGKDFDGDYTEIGYGMTISDIDYSVSLINNSEELDLRSADGDGETTLIFGIGYSWDL